jgi:hypothetical protein
VGSSLSPKTELEHLGPLTDCSYSPDSQYLVACDANRKVILYKLPEYQVITVCRPVACEDHFTAVSMCLTSVIPEQARVLTGI